jgi:cold shock CspA family protein/ribosome-associated translation inhibitor RaiA
MRLRKRVEKLEEFHPNVTGCTVAIEEQRKHHHAGRWFNVRLLVHVPNREIIVNRDHDEDPYVALRDAFDALTRRLEDIARLQRGDVKTHPTPVRGVVSRIVADQDYGFIETRDGNEYYFSRDNVVEPSFDQLKVGTHVQFIAEAGAEGMQAKRVSAGKHHALA